MPPNICILVLDAVRAANVSLYGHSRPTTPRIDALEDESVVFDYAVSPTGVTIDSTASLMSGQYPVEHQSGKKRHMGAREPLLQQRLRSNGYETGAVTCNPFLSPAFGFDTGFDRMFPVTQRDPAGMNMRRFYDETNDWSAIRRYLRFIQRAADRDFLSHLRNALQFKYGLFESDADDGATTATSWATDYVDESDQPWFLYVHYTETHMNSSHDLPYSVPESDLLRFIDGDASLDGLQTRSEKVSYSPEQRDIHERLYDGAIRYLDTHVGSIIDAIRKAGMWDDTIFIVTSDHGELLGEHGLLGHCYLYEPGVHVPLVIKLPVDDERRGTTVEDRISTVGLYRTMLEYLGYEVPPDARGGNILTDRPDTILAQDYSNSWQWSRYESGEVADTNALYRDGWKLIHGGSRTELYDLQSDPSEMNDQSDARSSMAEEFQSRLREFLGELNVSDTESGSDLHVDDATRERLADLGYL